MRYFGYFQQHSNLIYILAWRHYSVSFQIGASPNTTTSHLPWTSTKSVRMRDEVHADSKHMDRRQMYTTTYWWRERKGPFEGPNRRWEENNKTLSLYGSNIFPHDHPYFQHKFSIGPIVAACTKIRTASTTHFPTYVWECSLCLSGGSSWTQKCNSAYIMSIGCKM